MLRIDNMAPVRAVVLAMAFVLPAAPGLAAADQTAPPTARMQCWVDLYRGEPTPYEAILDDLAGVRVIYLGERHALARHHELQRRLVADLAARGVPLVLALEQMEAVYQRQLDQYARGEIDFDRLADATDWARRWSGHEQYRPVLEAAREAHAPMVALNARAETIRQVARSGGLAKLNPALRQELPETVRLDDPVYEALLRLQMQVHAAATPERLRPMIEAQMARDAMMAHTLATFLESSSGRGRTAIVLCGSGHAAYGLGTVARVRDRLPGVKDRIILMSESGDIELTPAMQAASRPITITHEQLRTIGRPVADYLHLTGPRPARQSEP